MLVWEHHEARGDDSIPRGYWNHETGEYTGRAVVIVRCQARAQGCKLVRCHKAGCTTHVCLSHGEGLGYWEWLYDLGYDEGLSRDVDFRVYKCRVKGCPVVFCTEHQEELDTCEECSRLYRAGYLAGAYSGPSKEAMDHLFRLCETHTTTCERRPAEKKKEEERAKKEREEAGEKEEEEVEGVENWEKEEEEREEKEEEGGGNEVCGLVCCPTCLDQHTCFDLEPEEYI